MPKFTQLVGHTQSTGKLQTQRVGAEAYGGGDNGMREMAAGFNKISERMLEVAIKKQERDDTVNRIYAEGDYKKKLSEIESKYTDAGNIGRTENLQAFGQELNDSMMDVLSSYQGTEAGRAKLYQNLYNYMNESSIEMSKKGRLEQKAVINSHNDEIIRNNNAIVGNNPGMVMDQIKLTLNGISETSSVLDPEEERTATTKAITSLVTTAVTKFLSASDDPANIDSAQAVLDDPDVIANMSVKERQALTMKISVARNKKSESSSKMEKFKKDYALMFPGQTMPDEVAQQAFQHAYLGNDSKTPEQKVRETNQALIDNNLPPMTEDQTYKLLGLEESNPRSSANERNRTYLVKNMTSFANGSLNPEDDAKFQSILVEKFQPKYYTDDRGVSRKIPVYVEPEMQRVINSRYGSIDNFYKLINTDQVGQQVVPKSSVEAEQVAMSKVSPQMQHQAKEVGLSKYPVFSETHDTPPPVEGDTAWDSAHLTQGLKAGIARMGNRFPLDSLGDAEISAATTQLNFIKNRIISTLRASKKFVVSENEELKDIINIEPDMMANSEAYFGRLLGIDNQLVNKVNEIDQELKDQGSLHIKDVRELKRARRAIEWSRGYLNVPDEIPPGQAGIEAVNALPIGSAYVYRDASTKKRMVGFKRHNFVQPGTSK